MTGINLNVFIILPKINLDLLYKKFLLNDKNDLYLFQGWEDFKTHISVRIRIIF